MTNGKRFRGKNVLKWRKSANTLRSLLSSVQKSSGVNGTYYNRLSRVSAQTSIKIAQRNHAAKIWKPLTNYGQGTVSRLLDTAVAKLTHTLFYPTFIFVVLPRADVHLRNFHGLNTNPFVYISQSKIMTSSCEKFDEFRCKPS